jgi:hypothetical protein
MQNCVQTYAPRRTKQRALLQVLNFTSNTPNQTQSVRTHERSTDEATRMKKLTTMTAVAALLCSNALSVKAATLTNWARGGIATQSTTYPGGDANKAIDGNTSGWWTEGFITHTADSENTVDARPWWQVDLQADRSIAHLHIWFRDDCCQPRNENLRIVIYDSADVATRKVVWESDTTQWANQVPRELGFDLNPPVTGRVIYVDHIPGLAVETHNFVSLAEVEAFDQPLIALDNFARDARGGGRDVEFLLSQRLRSVRSGAVHRRKPPRGNLDWWLAVGLLRPG